MIRPPPRSPLFPYTPLSQPRRLHRGGGREGAGLPPGAPPPLPRLAEPRRAPAADAGRLPPPGRGNGGGAPGGDRKSTRLNSRHHPISYAVFCLKKKKN